MAAKEYNFKPCVKRKNPSCSEGCKQKKIFYNAESKRFELLIPFRVYTLSPDASGLIQPPEHISNFV